MLKPQKVPVDINKQLRTTKEDKHARFTNGSITATSTRVLGSMTFDENQDLATEQLLQKSQNVTSSIDSQNFKSRMHRNNQQLTALHMSQDYDSRRSQLLPTGFDSTRVIQQKYPNFSPFGMNRGK